MNKQAFRLLIIATSLIMAKNVFSAAEPTWRERAASAVQKAKKAARNVVADFGYDQDIRLEENLLRAVAVDDTEKVAFFIDLIKSTPGADINYFSPEYKTTALEVAMERQNKEITELLKKNGARILNPSGKAISMMYDAVKSGDISAIQHAANLLDLHVPKELWADIFVETLNML